MRALIQRVTEATVQVDGVTVDAFAASLRDLGATVETGRFRADMRVTLVNDGPVTLLVEV